MWLQGKWRKCLFVRVLLDFIFGSELSNSVFDMEVIRQIFQFWMSHLNGHWSAVNRLNRNIIRCDTVEQINSFMHALESLTEDVSGHNASLSGAFEWNTATNEIGIGMSALDTSITPRRFK